MVKVIDISKSQNSINNLSLDCNTVKKSLESEFLSEIDSDKWNCMSKNKFNETIKSIINDMEQYESMLQNATDTLQDISQINSLNVKIDSLEKENAILSASLNNVKIIENNELIKTYKDMIMKLENKCRMRWE